MRDFKKTNQTGKTTKEEKGLGQQSVWVIKGRHDLKMTEEQTKVESELC